eukprot:s194_g35.t1
MDQFVMMWQLMQLQQLQQQAAMGQAASSSCGGVGSGLMMNPAQANLDGQEGLHDLRGRSRSPRASKAPSTTEVATLPESPVGDVCPPRDEVQTPEIIRPLLAISSEGDVNMSKAEAVERLDDLAKQAKERMDKQFTVCQTGDLVVRLQGLLGAQGPVINVQPIEGASWRKPSSNTWFAEKKGDARVLVYRLSIPPDPSHKKARNLSFQVAVGGRELTVKGAKGILQKLEPNIILMFGPHRSVEAAKTQAAGAKLDDFWGR